MKQRPATTVNAPSVVYLGIDDFPLGMAQTQKVRLCCRALLQEGCETTVLSRWWSVGKWNERPDLPPEGVFEGIRYVNACGHVFRPQGWLERKVARLHGFVRELTLIGHWRRTGKLDVAFLYCWSSFRLLYYVLLAKLYRFPIIMHVVEYYSAYMVNGNWREKLNARILDYFSLKFVDGVLPISAFLIERVEKYSPGLPLLKDPGLTDVGRYDGLKAAPTSKYLLYCGYLGYKEVILFCMRAFDLAATDPDVLLRLVVHGSHDEFARLETERRALEKADRIIVHSGLTDDELSQLYLDAYGLLIPLRPTDQDRARFPHKIGEYCGASRPVITTNIGEIAYRFTNGLNAFVAEHYDLAEYAAAIEDCLSDPSRADAVGAAGRVIAEEVHHYGAFAPHFKRFVLEVLARYRSKRLRARVPYPLDEDSPAPKTGKEAKRRLRAQPPPRTTPR